MMISGMLAFLSGSFGRLLFGELVSWLNKRQDHAQEIERLKLQNDLDAAAHARQIEAQTPQSELRIKVIEAKRDADLAGIDAEAWATAVADVGKQTGIKFIDLWNGSIRPLLATVAILVVLFEFVRAGFAMSDWDRELVGSILGLYVADRSLSRRGK